jgi:hypothetical protein
MGEGVRFEHEGQEVIGMGSIGKRALRSTGAVLLVVCGCIAPTVALGATEFGISKFTISATNEAGEPYTQAGGHPYEVTTDIEFNTLEDTVTHTQNPAQELRDSFADVPPGLVGYPAVTSRCSRGTFLRQECPSSTQVGTYSVRYQSSPGVPTIFEGPVYNLIPDPGHPAEFGIRTAGGVSFVLTAHVRTGKGYGITIGDAGIPAVSIEGVGLTFWGVPAAESHNAQRGRLCLQFPEEPPICEREGNEPSGALQVPFLTMPSSCSGKPLEATVVADSWENPGVLNADGTPDLAGGNWKTASATMPAMTDCGSLAFDPSLVVQPESGGTGFGATGGEPVGLHVNLGVPQTESPSLSATPDVRDVSVALPAGMVVSPSSANGLIACSNAQFALDSSGPGECPPASQIGTVKVLTPALPEQLVGDVFLGSPLCDPCTPADAQDGHMIRLFLQVIAEGESGVVVKLEGTASIDQQTGQIIATFKENPQLPFSDFKLSLGGGSRATLANSRVCGPARTSADLTPWSSPFTPDAHLTSTFEVTGCQGPQFNPSFTAGVTNLQAGAYGPFTVSFGRGDQDQYLSGLELKMPQGVLGKLASVPRCKEAQANEGTCGSESLIGHAQALAGPGADPYLVNGGQVFLTESYKGAPFGLSIVVPAVAGPYTLSGTTGHGTVVVRAKIEVDPHTAQVIVKSDPLPTVLDGIPLQIRAVNATIDRNEFTFGPTNCSKLQVTGTLSSAEGISAAVSSPFQVANCGSLRFKPKFTASTQAKTSKANGASLVVKVAPAAGQANIGKVRIVLPKQLPARLTTLQKACTDAVFNANPSACPAASAIGTAVARTPVLANPLTGPIYLVSHGGEAFPDAVIVLQGEGITLYLDGNTNIKKGITSSTFNSVPDAPVTSFEAKLPESPHSAFATNIPAKAKGSLCGQSLTMPTTLTGQNGGVLTQTTKIAVTGCPKKRGKAKKTSSHRHGKGKS